MNKKQVKDAIRDAFKKYANSPGVKIFNPIPRTLTTGKLYEAYILGIVAQNLTQKEGLKLTLVKGNEIRLRSSPGPIDNRFPHINVTNGLSSQAVAEIWTDIEFFTLSYSQRGRPIVPDRGDYHELDIVMIDPNLSGRPPHFSLWLGVECKNTKYNKQLLKEILGVRRELSYLNEPNRTKFKNYPQAFVPAFPPSCLLVFSSSPEVNQYKTPGAIFGIEFYYERI